LALRGDQLALLKAVVDSSAGPVIVVLVDGSPTSEPYLKDLDNVLAAFQGGQHGGQSIVDIISGAVNPSGRLPVTFPVSASVLPVFYNYKKSATRDGYCDLEGSSVLWNFGHGLSYSDFAYGDLNVEEETVSKDGKIVVTGTITNNGKVDGVAVPQVSERSDR